MDETNKTTGTMNEKRLNALLEYAGAGYVDYMAQLMDDDDKESDGEEPVIIPPEFDERMKKLIHRYEGVEKRKRAGKRARKVLARVAVILLILGGSLGILTTVSQAAKVKVYNFIIKVEEKFTSIHFIEKGGDSGTSGVKGIPSDWHDVYVPTYVPDGFEVVNAEDVGLIKIIDYKNSKGETITFDESPIESDKTEVDTENAYVEKVEVNGNEGLLIEKKGYTTLVWHNNDDVFYLRAQLDKSEVFKMAESVKSKE